MSNYEVIDYYIQGRIANHYILIDFTDDHTTKNLDH